MLKEKNSKRETRRKDTHIRVVGGVLVVPVVGAQSSDPNKPGAARADVDSPVAVLTHQHDPSKHCIAEKLPSASH